jgi:hypothetical protein
MLPEAAAREGVRVCGSCGLLRVATRGGRPCVGGLLVLGRQRGDYAADDASPACICAYLPVPKASLGQRVLWLCTSEIMLKVTLCAA